MLAFASTIIFGYFIVYYITVIQWEIATVSLKPSIPIIVEAILYILILGLSYFGGLDQDFDAGDFTIMSPSQNRSLAFLFISTLLFLLLISIPIFFFGGAINSIFSTMLVTMCGLTVIVTDSPRIRFTIIAVCICIYISSAIWYFDLTVNSQRAHKVFHILSVSISLGVTLFLSWRGKFTIFSRKKEANGINRPQTA